MQLAVKALFSFHQIFSSWNYMGVEPKIVGIFTPKWMVKIMENPIKIHGLGVVFPLFLETSI